VASGRRKHHHTHELGDPYAEGWEARGRFARRPRKRLPRNPYALPPEMLARQSEGRRALQTVEAAQWQAGWNDWEEDSERGDLAEVTPKDFENLGKPPVKRAVEDEDF